MITGRLPVDFPARLRARGVTVVEVGGWRDRVSSSAGWVAEGWALHHDAGSQVNPGSPTAVKRFVDLHTHLLHGSVTYMGGVPTDGVLYLWGGGRSRNAGLVDSHWRNVMLAGDTVPDVPRSRIGAELNSTPLLGGFMLNGGVAFADNFESPQMRTAKLIGVCLVLDYGYPTATLLEHRQWSGYRGKGDPSWGADNWRRLVEAELAQEVPVALPAINPPLPLVDMVNVGGGTRQLFADGSVYDWGVKHVGAPKLPAGRKATRFADMTADRFVVVLDNDQRLTVGGARAVACGQLHGQTVTLASGEKVKVTQ